MSKKTKLRASAEGRECQIRIPGVCNGNPETTVLCHLPGGGMGRKQPDLLGAWGCSACHDVVDGRVKVKRWALGDTSPYCEQEIYVMFLEGVIRTQQIWLDEGLVEIK